MPLSDCERMFGADFKGNTARPLCVRCAVGFFVRLHRKFAGILPYGKNFLCDMTENPQVDGTQRYPPVVVRYCLSKDIDSVGFNSVFIDFPENNLPVTLPARIESNFF